MPDAAYLALDWGTTNRRLYVVAGDGAVLHRAQDDRGVLTIPADGYPAEIAAIRSAHGDVPIIAAGMIGSTRGLHDVPHVPAPAGLAALAAGCMQAAQGVTIVPGVSRRDDRRADVMRGEEVQVFGAIAAGLAPADALFCQPGTHNKWIVAEAGTITDFTTAMTGELFALLKAHGILAGMLDGTVADGPAFRDGLARGGAGDLLAALFEVRASVLLGTRAPEDAASFASGILIGADVAPRPDLAGRTVHLLGSGALATLYAVAIEQAGARPIAIDSEAAFLAGIHTLREHLQ
jgi:2-dehydro-3-deoxygalactonokinase